MPVNVAGKAHNESEPPGNESGDPILESGSRINGNGDPDNVAEKLGNESEDRGNESESRVPGSGDLGNKRGDLGKESGGRGNERGDLRIVALHRFKRQFKVDKALGILGSTISALVGCRNSGIKTPWLEVS